MCIERILCAVAVSLQHHDDREPIWWCNLTHSGEACILLEPIGLRSAGAMITLVRCGAVRTQVAAPARRKTLRGNDGRTELRLALMRLRMLRRAVAKAQTGEGRTDCAFRSPLGLPEGIFAWKEYGRSP